ncbi:hypothetical protein SLA2020_062320 [Shorea laevis]
MRDSNAVFRAKPLSTRISVCTRVMRDEREDSVLVRNLKVSVVGKQPSLLRLLNRTCIVSRSPDRAALLVSSS